VKQRVQNFVSKFENEHRYEIINSGQNSGTQTKKEVWRKVNMELESFGITPGVSEAHREIIVSTLKDAALARKTAATGHDDGNTFAMILLGLLNPAFLTLTASAKALLLDDFFSDQIDDDSRLEIYGKIALGIFRMAALGF